ncbi:MAG: dihydrodipicolinate synthase family protein [Cardiobacteriaceae bacterium]|nr:dihydrodipicolinate synthase family protein [Cardiobacteriaceae bacterium]
MTQASPFHGVVPPILTPRHADGRMDGESLARLVHHLLDGGVHGIFALGSSGEVPYLTNGERETVVRIVADINAGKVPVFAGACEMTTRRVIEEGKKMLGSGADALVVTTPFYALSNEQELETHFRQIHKALQCPVFAYDVPVRTHMKMGVGLLAKLAQEGVIAGVKDSSGDDVSFRRLMLATRDVPNFAVFTGHEVVVDGAFLSGAHGVVPGLGNVDPRGYVAMYDAYRAGDWEKVRKEQDRLSRLFDIVFTPAPGRVSAGAAGLGAFKTALVAMGVIESNRMSDPMLSLNDEEKARIEAILREVGLL